MIPKIDTEIGISVYSTSFSGCGGTIRENEDDFQVTEILSDKAHNSIKEKEGYAVYKLKKRNIDTTHALQEIFRESRTRLKSLGLKDASAVSEQYVSQISKSKPLQNILTKNYSLEHIGFSKKPLTKKDMIGNHFKIKISKTQNDFSKFNEFDKILNFYGYQRFGSQRPVTHLVGKAIVQKNFEDAIQILLSQTSEYDSDENNKLRKKLKDFTNFAKTLKEIPRGMDLERIVVNQMISHKDPLRAIRALPILIRRIFVQAYQAFLFNKTVSAAFENGENLFSPEQGDICYDQNGIIGKYIQGLEQHLSIPLLGYSYYKKTRFDYYISKILEEEEISTKDFFVKELQEVSSEGGFRNSKVVISNTSLSKDTISFTLSRGSFATIVLREIMKPENPILSGF